MKLQNILRIVVAAALLVTSVSALVAQNSPAPKPTAQPSAPAKIAHRITLPINSEDAVAMKQVLSTALHLSMHYQSRNEGFAMEIVGYSAGVHMFRADTSPVREQLIKLLAVNPNIRFVICEATKLGMERAEGKSVPLFENVQVTPNGPAYLVELQEKGWSYIRT